MKTGSTNITERVGKTVLYTLTEEDARGIMQRRQQLGQAIAGGNDVREGDTYPALIVRDFGLSGSPAAQEERTRQLNRTLTARYRKSQGKADAEALAEPGYPSEYANMTEAEFQRHKAAEIEKIQASWIVQALQASVNLRVMLDGHDDYWATSRSQFDPMQHGRWVRDFAEDETPDKRNSSDWEPDTRGHWQVIA
jgi:hypothetical protein